MQFFFGEWANKITEFKFTIKFLQMDLVDDVNVALYLSNDNYIEMPVLTVPNSPYINSMNSTSTPERGIWKIISASSVGTLIEWYDFYIFGSLATVLASQFFPKTNPTAALLSTLATFAAGFIVRPFGALVFGRLGDLIGRKYTFLLTLIIMGGATFLIGCIPSYATIGGWAPFLVLMLRLLQGLALGGEYGGAATYVAEHSPEHKRGKKKKRKPK